MIARGTGEGLYYGKMGKTCWPAENCSPSNRIARAMSPDSHSDTDTGSNESWQPRLARRPTTGVIWSAYLCSLLLIVAFVFLPCGCGYLDAWALLATVPCVLLACYTFCGIDRTMGLWRDVAGALVIFAFLMLLKNIGDILWFGHDAVW